MCGIAGVFYSDGRTCNHETLQRMARAMAERGPDDEGVFLGEGVGLVHRRLSIIDLSSAGRCPMSNEDGAVRVVLNGEIYNYASLRKELQAKGHVFESQSDTEVVVHGYEEWGKDIVHRLSGMFAFAVWDQHKGQLFIARDRVGEKPLYYGIFQGCVVFASTLAAIRAFAGNSLEVNPHALDCFLSHSFIPGSHTIWLDVNSLPPAHRAVAQRGCGLHIERYWDFPTGRPRKMAVAEAEAAIEEALRNSVRERLVADVPVGGFLSGGVDSSLVMALAAQHSAAINTFAVGFQERNGSELPFAERVAKTIGSTHHELLITERDVLSVVPELVWQFGQPFGDSSAVPTFLLSRFARERVKVSLSGDGGDESFAGYWRAVAGWYASMYRKAIPAILREKWVPALCRGLGDNHSLGQRLLALNTLATSPPGAGYTNAQSWLNLRAEILGPVVLSQLNHHSPVACRTGRPWVQEGDSSLRQLLYDDFQVLLPDDYLTKVDVASMAASLEVRAPFLDHIFLENAWLIPDNLKLRFGHRKWLLKRLAAKHVPSEVVYRRKTGFSLPMAEWWRGPLAKVLEALVQDSRAVSWGWIRREPVLRALQEHVTGSARHEVRLWTILWLELWARIVVEQSIPRSVSLTDLY